MLIPNTKHEGHRSRPVIYSTDPKNEANDMYITCINKAFFLCNEKDKGGRGFSRDKNLILFSAGTTWKTTFN